MRGLFFFLIFISGLPFIFVTPFNGVLAWYAFSLGNFHTLIWGGPFAGLYYAYVIAIITCMSWLFSPDKKRLPITPLVILTLLFAAWITITSFFALAPAAVVWPTLIETQKMLFMCLVGYALMTTRERIDQLIWVVVISEGVWGTKGAILSILHGGSRIHGPDAGVNADNNHFAVALTMILPLIFYHWQLARSRRMRFGLMVFGIVVCLAVGLTYSRGGMLGLCAAGSVFWARSRAKFSSGVIILLAALAIYEVAPPAWFSRMDSIENYQDDASANGRINVWRTSLRVAEAHPLGGGFNVTTWPNAINPLLIGTDIPRYSVGRAAHSEYFQVLSEHGWFGLALFLTIGACSWANCVRLIRTSRNRADLAWANALGRMGQASLVGYWVGGAFASLAYFDEYWCILMVLDAARRVAVTSIALPTSTSATTLPKPRPAVGAPGLAIADRQQVSPLSS